MIDRRLLLTGGGAALGIGLWQMRGLAAERLGYDATRDFALTGQLTQGGWARGRAPVGTRVLRFNRNAVILAPDRSFFIAFDRDATARADILADLADGTTARGALTIAPRAWQIERIPLGPKPGAPPNPCAPGPTPDVRPNAWHCGYRPAPRGGFCLLEAARRRLT